VKERVSERVGESMNELIFFLDLGTGHIWGILQRGNSLGKWLANADIWLEIWCVGDETTL